MILERLRKKVSITNKGAIILGKHVTCDGVDFKRPISIFSHAHGDHVGAFETALSICSAVIVTKETKDLLVALRGDYLLKRTNLIALPFGEIYEYKGSKITLHPIDHMLGSCQVLLVNDNDDRIVYTGDFAHPNDQVLKADALVIEATYGNPNEDRIKSQKTLTEKLISVVKEGIVKQKQVRVIAHTGKIQCLMSKLTNANVNVPFLAGLKDTKWADVYKRHGINIGEVHNDKSIEGFEIQKSGQPYILFNRFGGSIPDIKNCVTIRASRFRAAADIYQPRKDYYVIAMSDHADFDGLVEYVKKSGAKLVITDWSRCEMAGELARYIRNKLCIDAVALPPRFSPESSQHP